MHYSPPVRYHQDYDLFRLSDDQELTDELLLGFITKHEQRVSRRYAPLWRAYCGQYDIFDKSIVPPREPWQPDNRLAVNFAQYGTDTFVGFNFGNPLKVSYEGEDDPDAVNGYIDDVRDRNEMEDLDAQTATDAFIFGAGQRILYLDEGETGVIGVSPLDGFPIYNDSVRPRLRYFVRLYVDTQNVQRGSISDERDVRYFRRDGSITWEGEAQPHGFPGVPAVIYPFNSSRMGGFENTMPIINAVNSILSDKWNSVQSLADAYLLVKGPEVDAAMSKILRTAGIINPHGPQAKDADVRFLSRPDGDGVQEHALDRLTDLIFLTMMVNNISDDRFSTSSGIALKYKMLPMINLAATQWRKFHAAEKQMWKLICGNPATPFGPDDWKRIRYVHTLNYPANVADEASTASNLNGITSKRTQLSVLSVVHDVDKELEQIEEEQQKAAARSLELAAAQAAITAKAGEKPAENSGENGENA